MNRMLFLAGLGSAAVGAVHVFAGGASVHTAMLDAEFGAGAKATMTACWHAISLVFGVFAAAGVRAGFGSRASGNAVALLGAALFLPFAALFVWLTLTQFGDLMRLEQWTLLGPLGLLFLTGYRRR